jgi:hypothetical protein
MKLPGLRLNLEGIGGFLLRHGEKLLGVLALLGAALLVWSGIDAVRVKGVREEQLPSAIEREAERADAHVGRVKQAPAEFLAALDPLSDRLDPWRSPLPPWRAVAALELADPPQVSLLDKPIFQELAKRTKPDIFPVEELHAVAGVALVATKSQAGSRGGDQAPAGTAAKLAPYVIVTGLLPVRKQEDEYRGRFQSASYKDATRGVPLGSDCELERTVVVPGPAEKWESIDLAAAARAVTRDWGAAAAEQPPPGWLLEQTPPVPFFGGLPQRVDGGWGIDALHPRLLEAMARQPKPGVGEASDARPEIEPAAGGPGFGDLPAQPAPEERPEQAVVAAPPFRLIRFIDMGVETGRAYKYRARVKVWNPNLKLAPQHVADPGLALDQKLSSPPSSASNAVVVPGTIRILANMLSKDEAKRLKLRPGTYEMLVLAPTAAGDGYSLRAVYGEVGGVADVDPKAPKMPGETRSRGEPVVTGRMLVDARGRQEGRDTAPTGRGGSRKPDRELVPEPLEMLCLRPDGSFEFVSAADVERDVARYANTLPSVEGGPPSDRGAVPEDGQPVPDEPFAFPGSGRRR